MPIGNIMNLRLYSTREKGKENGIYTHSHKGKPKQLNKILYTQRKRDDILIKGGK